MPKVTQCPVSDKSSPVLVFGQRLSLPDLIRYKFRPVDPSRLCRGSGVRRVSLRFGEQLDLPSAPTCDTGALLSALPSSKIDWLEFRFDRFLVDQVPALLGLDREDFDLAEGGLQSYPEFIQYGACKILFDSKREDRGTKVILSGSALDQCKRDALDILRRALDLGCSFTRVDLALDDRAGLLDMQTVQAAILGGLVVSRFQKGRPIQDYDLTTGQPVGGLTWYFGSGQSLRSVRIYDKQAERIDKGEDDPGAWIRAELQTRKGAAHNLALALAGGGLEISGGIFRGVLDFRYKDDDQSNRRTPVEWWDTLLGGLSVVRTGLGKIPKTIQEKASWLSHQVSKTLGQVSCILGAEVVVQLIRTGIEKTSRREWRRLDCATFAGFSGAEREDYGRLVDPALALQSVAGVPF